MFRVLALKPERSDCGGLDMCRGVTVKVSLLMLKMEVAERATRRFFGDRERGNWCERRHAHAGLHGGFSGHSTAVS